MLQQLFRKYFRYARMTSLKFSKFNFFAAVDNIYAQFVPVNRGINYAYIMLQQLFQKYFMYAGMTSFVFETIIEFSAAISMIRNVYAQFVLMNRGLTSTCIMLI